MILISTEQVLSHKSTQMIPLQCDYCQHPFERVQKNIKYYLKRRQYQKHFCSQACANKSVDIRKEVVCQQCHKSFLKKRSELKKCPNSFCSSSCAAVYNNTHKTKGTRRSKFEVCLAEILPIKYPNLEFHFNSKSIINSELDIYITNLKLAFELNGIFHYEPIFGADKLSKIQNNDGRKFQACLEKGIELCIIDTSTMDYFKQNKCQKYLDIIFGIIDLKLSKNTYNLP